jgi:hypothetical protein
MSCEKEEGFCYSCNQNIDNWARENVDLISDMSREDIVELSGEKQRAAFRVMSPDKRKKIWLEKLSGLLDQDQSYEEFKLLNYVIDIAKGLSFSRELTDNEYYAIEHELLNLVEEAGWTRSQMVYTFGTLQLKPSTGANDFFSNGIEANESLQQKLDCNCSWGWCGSTDECEEDDCEETDFGCGFLLLGSCDKICGGNPTIDP